MSDIGDDCEGVSALQMGGARFGKETKLPVRHEINLCRKCGTKPIHRPFLSKEILQCPKCMRQTTPNGSRQRLLKEWNDMNTRKP